MPVLEDVSALGARAISALELLEDVHVLTEPEELTMRAHVGQTVAICY